MPFMICVSHIFITAGYGLVEHRGNLCKHIHDGREGGVRIYGFNFPTSQIVSKISFSFIVDYIVSHTIQNMSITHIIVE